MKRISISVTDWQASALEEIAAREETSVAHVVRDALRSTLPRLVEVVRFLGEMDENNSGQLDPEEASHLMANLGSVLDRFGSLADGAGVGEDDVATPTPRRFSNGPKPPSGNTGAHE